MKAFLFGTSSIILICCLILGLVVGPLLTLWSINTLAEVSGAALYIPHTIKTYFCVFLLLCAFRGGKG